MALVKYINPKLNVEVPPEIVFQGAKLSAYVQYTPTSLSNSNNVISVTAPSKRIGVARNVLVQAQFTSTITLTNTSGGVPFPDGYIGPRLAPLASVIGTQTVVINNMSVQQSTSNQIIKPLMHYLGSYNQRFATFSTFPSMLDQTQKYSQALNTIRNPLASPLNNSYDESRNNSACFALTGNTIGSTAVTSVISTSEPIFLLNPFSAGSEGYHDSVLFHLDTLTWTMTMSNLNRVLSISDVLPAGVAITGITTNLTKLVMQFNYITPHVEYPIPDSIKYSSYTPMLYTTNVQQTVVGGVSFTASTSSIQLQGIPQKIFIWASHPDSARSTDPGSYGLTDSVAALTSLTVYYNTELFLSGATSEDLYNIAVKNGSRLSYPQWSDRMGSVLSLSFGDDIGLPGDQAPGMQGQQQIYFTGTWKNPAGAATIVNPQIYVLVIYGGSIVDQDGSFTIQQNQVTAADVASAPISAMSTKHSQPLIGGGFLDILKKAASPLLDIATPIISSYVPGASKFINFGRRLVGVGHGCGSAYSGGNYAEPSAKRPRGGKYYPSKAELMNME